MEVTDRIEFRKIKCVDQIIKTYEMTGLQTLYKTRFSEGADEGDPGVTIRTGRDSYLQTEQAVERRSEWLQQQMITEVYLGRAPA